MLRCETPRYVRGDATSIVVPPGVSMKRVLVISYSQSGQLTNILDSILEPLRASEDVDVTVETVRPKQPYPFPWPLRDFFQIVPECVLMDPPALEPLTFDEHASWDLIIVGYQVWFLSPSLPITGFLKSEKGKHVLRNRPVITVIGCRDMWVMAQQKVKKLLAKHGAVLIDNIALIDHRSGLASIINTPLWVLTGKKNTLFGAMPEPGVTEDDIRGARRFGEAILKGLLDGAVERRETLLRGLGAVTLDPRLIAVEWGANVFFQVWARLGKLSGPLWSLRRDPVTIFFALSLPVLLVTAAPPILLTQWALRPILGPIIEKQADRYAEPSGRERFSSRRQPDEQ